MRLSFLVECPILYLAFFKTILAALFRAFGLPLSFLPSKPSFLHDHSTTQHSDVSSFLAISTINKPVNQSIQAYALAQLDVFALRGFIVRDIYKKQGRSSRNSGYEIQKICGHSRPQCLRVWECARKLWETLRRNSQNLAIWASQRMLFDPTQNFCFFYICFISKCCVASVLD